MLLLALAGVAVASGLTRELSLERLASHRTAWTAAAQAHPVQSVAIYIGAYALLTAAGLPIALVLTLTGGLIFGTLVGGLATAVACTAAALISYAAARYALADWFQGRLTAGSRMERMVQALRRSGFWYLLSARFMPVMPFSLLNFACGIAHVPLRTYVLTTLAGALPASMIYAGLGAGLGDSLDAGGIAHAAHSPTIWLALGGLAVLSLLPALLRRRS
jgi:uncharacterized membrane protein YdjX (TVP38/TMEM64 family)